MTQTSLSNQPQRSTLHSWGYYTELQEVFKRFEVAEVMPSPADVKSAFNARHRSDDVQVERISDKPDPSNDFYKAFDDFVRVCGRQNDWTHATYEKVCCGEESPQSLPSRP